MGLVRAVIGAIFVATMSRLLSDEFKAWGPCIIEHLICFAVRRLPAKYRKRFSEEWRSHITEVPGDIAKIIVAFGFIRASRAIRYRFRMPRFQQALGLLALIFFAPLFMVISIWLLLEQRQSPITKSKGRCRFRVKPGGVISRFILRVPAIAELPALIDVAMGRAVIHVVSRKEVPENACRTLKSWGWWIGR
jgi:hypothetical protein